MTLTLENIPPANQAAHNEIIYDYDTSRSGNAANSVTGVADVGNVVVLTVASHTYAVDDVLTGSAFTDSGLNVRCLLTAQTATTLTTNIVWDAAYTGDTGTITKNNDNLRARIQVKVGATVKGTRWVDYVDYAGTNYFRFDASEFVKYLVSPTILDLGLSDIESASTQESAIEYTLSITLFYDTYNYAGLFEDDTITTTTSGGDPLIAYNLRMVDGKTVLNDYILDKALSGEFFTNNKDWVMRTGEEFQLSFISLMSSTKMKWTIVEVDGTPHNGFTALETMVDNFAVAPVSSLLWNTWADTWAAATIQIWTEDGGEAATGEVISITNPDRCIADGQRLEYNNAVGGFDAYTFSKRTDNDKTAAAIYTGTEEKTANIDQQPVMELEGYHENNDNMAIYSEMYRSKEMYVIEDAARDRVNNAGNTQVIRARNWQVPVMKLRKQKDYIL